MRMSELKIKWAREKKNICVRRENEREIIGRITHGKF
jgi:hypothetical protein